jgi:predicted aspartyl protease
MKIQMRDGLPYIIATVFHQGRQLALENILIDTGSAGTIITTEKILEIGIQYEPEDFVHRIRGVGGSEFVFTKQIDRLSIDNLQVNLFEIEVGALDYGFQIDGIAGMDFLTQIKAVIDLDQMEIRSL